MDIDSETSNLKVTGPMKKTRETRYPAPKPKQSFAPHSWQDFTEKNLAWANGMCKYLFNHYFQLGSEFTHDLGLLKSIQVQVRLGVSPSLVSRYCEGYSFL